MFALGAEGEATEAPGCDAGSVGLVLIHQRFDPPPAQSLTSGPRPDPWSFHDEIPFGS